MTREGVSMFTVFLIALTVLGAGVLARTWLRDRRLVREGKAPKRVSGYARGADAGNGAQAMGYGAQAYNSHRGGGSAGR